ncbi:MAG: aminoglycoside phosphotransferase family protein [Gaiellaceae bacterium]
MGRPTLPRRLREIADAWDLALGEELPAGPFARCLEAITADGGEAVLKVWSPPARGADELCALRAWNGHGAPVVLRADALGGAALLERVRPGDAAPDATAEEVATLLSLLRVEPPSSLPLLAEIVQARLRLAVAESRARGARVEWAWHALSRLSAGAPAAVLVHGHLGPRSVVRCARRGLCAVDPLPCAGDPAYDAAAWIHAAGRPGRRARFEALAGAAGLDRARLRDWCGVVAVHG